MYFCDVNLILKIKFIKTTETMLLLKENKVFVESPNKLRHH